MNSYLVGETVRLYCDFYSLAGALTDPTTVSLIVEDPAGVQTTYSLAGGTVTKESTGVFYSEVAVAAPVGIWSYRWTATGAVKALTEESYKVIGSRLG